MLTNSWTTSRFSKRTNCVQVRRRDTVDVRDTKDPGPMLRFSPAAGRAFLGTIKTGGS
jgi:Domain of unknown function (DUF397)